MRIEIENISENPVSVLRRLGYVFYRNEANEMSLVRSLSSSGYPRFHMYVKMDGTRMMVHIHLDAKKETYGKDTRHHGEYGNEGPLKEEVERIKSILG